MLLSGMRLICLDLEGVLYPEVWLAIANSLSCEELRLTTRDVPDYDELMQHRIQTLGNLSVDFRQIELILSDLEPLPGAGDFLARLQERHQVVILSDTFEQFTHRIRAQLRHPLILCNELVIRDGAISGYRMRQADGKRRAVEAFRSLNLIAYPAGDSYNDLNMIRAADSGCLFQAPNAIIEENPDLAHAETYDELLKWAFEPAGHKELPA